MEVIWMSMRIVASINLLDSTGDYSSVSDDNIIDSDGYDNSSDKI